MLCPTHPSVLRVAPGFTPKAQEGPLDPTPGGQPLPLRLQLQLPEENPLLLAERIRLEEAGGGSQQIPSLQNKD